MDWIGLDLEMRTMDDDFMHRSVDKNGTPYGRPVEQYGRRPSTARYRCERCGSTNIDDFHVDGTGGGRDSKGYKIKGVHDEEGFPCGGRCWPWVHERQADERAANADVSLETALKGLGEIGGALHEGFRNIFRRP